MVDDVENSLLQRYQALACGILYEAVRDWRVASQSNVTVEEMENGALPDNLPWGAISTIEKAAASGFASPRKELLSFFLSDWCAYLCEAVGLSYDTLLEHIYASI